MNFDQFTKLYKEYEIFPALISIVKMKSIFQVLIECYKHSLGTDKGKYESINKDIFLKSILLVAHFLKTEQQKDNQIEIKLVTLLEIMSNS
jgi:hypothetical protein